MSGSVEASSGKARAPVRRVSQARNTNRLKDEVYRQMLLLEVKRPGAEMGLALALLRAVVASGTNEDEADFSEWLKTVCSLGLDMIETSLRSGLP